MPFTFFTYTLYLLQNFVFCITTPNYSKCVKNDLHSLPTGNVMGTIDFYQRWLSGIYSLYLIHKDCHPLTIFSIRSAMYPQWLCHCRWTACAIFCTVRANQVWPKDLLSLFLLAQRSSLHRWSLWCLHKLSWCCGTTWHWPLNANEHRELKNGIISARWLFLTELSKVLSIPCMRSQMQGCSQLQTTITEAVIVTMVTTARERSCVDSCTHMHTHTHSLF